VPKEFNTIKKGISLCSIFAATSGQLSPPPLLSIYNINHGSILGHCEKEYIDENR
tara:strand:+ start:1311 stop:1475 length:165 start_codon:yes stop_codon:yes gene_type:complete